MARAATHDSERATNRTPDCKGQSTSQASTGALSQDGEECFRTLADNMPDGLLVLDPADPSVAFRILYVNRAAATDDGYSVEELQDKSFLILLDSSRSITDLQQRVADIIRFKICEFQAEHRHRDGHLVPYEVRAVRIIWQNRPAILAINRNISERRRAEAKLRSTKAFFETFMANSPAAAWVSDRNGKVTYASPAYARIFPVGDPTDKNVFEIYPRHLAEEYRRNDEQVLAENRTLETVESGFRVDGTPGQFLACKFPMRGDDGSLCVGGVAIDISEQKRSEEALREQRAEIAHLSRVSSVGELASSLAHELNQPLTSILSYAGVCLDAMHLHPNSPCSPTTVAHLEELAAEAKRAGEIIRRFAAYVRKQVPQRRTADINTIIHDAVKLMKYEFRRAGVTPQLLLGDVGIPVEVDAVQIQQVMVNLFQNALDAMDAVDPQSRDLRISTHLAESGEIRVCVKDSGTGIAPGMEMRIFESFFTTKPKGLGLGLSICRSIIESHGGILSATRDVDGGMLFQFSLSYASHAGDDLSEGLRNDSNIYMPDGDKI